MRGLGGMQSGLRQFFDIQLTALILIQSLELCFHKLHVLCLGYFAVLVGIHEKQQLLDLVLAKCQLIVWVRSCRSFRLRSCGPGRFAGRGDQWPRRHT